MKILGGLFIAVILTGCVTVKHRGIRQDYFIEDYVEWKAQETQIKKEVPSYLLIFITLIL